TPQAARKRPTAPRSPREKSPQRGESHSLRWSSRRAQAAAMTARMTVGTTASTQKASRPERSGEKAKYDAVPETTRAVARKATAKGRMAEGIDGTGGERISARSDTLRLHGPIGLDRRCQRGPLRQTPRRLRRARRAGDGDRMPGDHAG